MKYLLVVLFTTFLLSCKKPVFNDGKVHTFRMVDYMSKAWIDSSVITEIKIYPKNEFEFLIEGKIDFKGEIEFKGDSLNILGEHCQMPANFLDANKKLFRIHQTTCMDLEAKWVDFKRVD